MSESESLVLELRCNQKKIKIEVFSRGSWGRKHEFQLERLLFHSYSSSSTRLEVLSSLRWNNSRWRPSRWLALTHFLLIFWLWCLCSVQRLILSCLAVDVVSSIGFEKSGDYLAVGDRGGRVVIFQAKHGKHVRIFFS